MVVSSRLALLFLLNVTFFRATRLISRGHPTKTELMTLQVYLLLPTF